MECNKDEAYRAKEIAEKKLLEKNTKEAKKLALKAQSLFPGIEGIPQLVAAIDVHTASEKKINGETDWYSILAVQPQADNDTIRKQYRKLALMLHPDKNKSLGADSAFKFVSQAWSLLSDNAKRASYDKKIRTFLPGAFHNASKPKKTHHKSAKAADFSAPSSSREAKATTFWTSCHRCKMQYEYLRVYKNQNLLCPHCRESFLAIETLPPGKKASSKQTNGHSSSTFGDSSYHHHSNMRWSSFSNIDNPSRIVNAASVVQQAYAKAKRNRVEAQVASKREEALKRKSLSKKLETAKPSSKRRKPTDPKDSLLLDYRTLCLRKARNSITKMLKEWNSTKPRSQIPHFPLEEHSKVSPNHQRLTSVEEAVEDPQFYLFDRHRTAECFKKDQVWAAYDMFDGMPRHYGVIKSVISLHPFNIEVRWLTPNFTSLHSLHWVASGFPQSCGEFRPGQAATCHTCTMFSHRALSEATPNGAVRILPAKGDVWALYKNWSLSWSELTSEEAVRRYEAVEVAEGCDEQSSVAVVPLIKVAGFRTVFRQHVREMRRIDVREMMRFSHQIPYRVLRGDEGLDAPKGCVELDPAATPDDLQLIVDA